MKAVATSTQTGSMSAPDITKVVFALVFPIGILWERTSVVPLTNWGLPRNGRGQAEVQMVLPVMLESGICSCKNTVASLDFAFAWSWSMFRATMPA